MEGEYYVLESGISVPKDAVPIGPRLVDAFLSPNEIPIPKDYIVQKDTEMQHIGVCETIDLLTLDFTVKEAGLSGIVNLEALDELTDMLNEEE